MKTFVIIAALAAIAAPAAAQVNPDVRQTVLKFADLDLSRSAGASVMAARIHQAALVVCGDASATRDLVGRSAHNACMSQTMAATVNQVNAPLVSARFSVPSANAKLAAK